MNTPYGPCNYELYFPYHNLPILYKNPYHSNCSLLFYFLQVSNISPNLPYITHTHTHTHTHTIMMSPSAFLMLVMLMALAITTVTPYENDLFLNDEDSATKQNNLDDVPFSETQEPISLRGTSRFLAQSSRVVMTCNKYPRVCHAEGNPKARLL